MYVCMYVRMYVRMYVSPKLPDQKARKAHDSSLEQNGTAKPISVLESECWF